MKNRTRRRRLVHTPFYKVPEFWQCVGLMGATLTTIGLFTVAVLVEQGII